MMFSFFESSSHIGLQTHRITNQLLQIKSQLLEKKVTLIIIMRKQVVISMA